MSRAERTARSRLDSVPLRNFCAHVDRTSDPEPTRFLDQSLAQTWVTEMRPSLSASTISIMFPAGWSPGQARAGAGYLHRAFGAGFESAY